jgi:peptidoglycan-N-acetylglucosamine deacetylase
MAGTVESVSGSAGCDAARISLKEMPARLPALPTRRAIGAAIRISVVVHLLALLLLLYWPFWPVSLAVLALNHLVLVLAGLWPRSTLLGPNQRRLSERAAAAGQVALTIDDGPEPLVTLQVLELLDRFNCKATFFCVGERVAAHAEIAREIARRGHQIENHTQHHFNYFSLLGPEGMRREIYRAQRVIATIAGVRPRYFRAPAGLRNPFLEPVLCAGDLRLVSWTRRGFDTVTNDPGLILARLTRNLRAGDILLLHDGHAARTADGSPVILLVLPELLAAFARAGLNPVTLSEAL